MTDRPIPSCTTDLPPAVERWLERRKDAARRIAARPALDEAVATAAVMQLVADAERVRAGAAAADPAR